MLQNVRNDSSIRLAYSGNVLFAYFKANLGVEQIRHLDEAAAGLSARYPAGIGIMAMKAEGTDAPSPEIRGLITESLQKNGAKVLAMAFIPEAQGIKATILRTVANTLLLTARLKHARVHGELASAAKWLVPYLGPGGGHVSAEQLAEDARLVCRDGKAAAAGKS